MVNQVENWSYSSRDVQLEVPVSVTYAIDVVCAESLMRRATRESPRLPADPEPSLVREWPRNEYGLPASRSRMLRP
jgi:small-conductance mechanosensitive channel